MLFLRKVIKYLGSIKLTIFCLAILFILVLAGTFYQVDFGLLAAQKRFFGSWGLLLFNFLPFPGLKTIAFILTVNLLSAGLHKFAFSLRKTGVLLIHLGTAVLFLGAGISSFFVQESILSLYEGESASFSRDFTKWEVVIIRGNSQSGLKTDTAQFSRLKTGLQISLPNTQVNLTVNLMYSNCDGLGYSPEKIDSLQPKPPSRDMAGSFPGMILTINNSTGSDIVNSKVTLFGGSPVPAVCTMGSDTIIFKLKPHDIKLPFNIGLTKFIKENHPGTTDAKSFKSFIKVTGEGINRDAVISMNRPFRYKTLTFYQNGFSQQERGNMTTLLVVENPTRFVPYLSGILVMLGLMIHFIGKFAASYKGLRRNTTAK